MSKVCEGIVPARSAAESLLLLGKSSKTPPRCCSTVTYGIVSGLCVFFAPLCCLKVELTSCLCVFCLRSGSCCGPSSSSSPSVCCSSGSTSGGRRTTTTASSTGECAASRLQRVHSGQTGAGVPSANKLDWSTLRLFLISQIILFNPPSAFNLSRNHPD